MNATIPTLVGGIPLEIDQSVQMPERTRPKETSRLRLPQRDGMEFHLLKNGQQFLAIYPGPRTWWTIDGRAFFGGMDEAPFLTAMQHPAVEAFRTGGEQGFFEALVPKPIKLFKEKFPEAIVRRQGDVWSLRLPMTWEELRAIIRRPAMAEVKKHDNRHTKRQIRRQNIGRRRNFEKHLARFEQTNRYSGFILGTGSHAVHGRCVSGQFFMFEGIDLSRLPTTLIAEGVLTAPDHARQELTGGPHVLARTPHIAMQRLAGGD